MTEELKEKINIKKDWLFVCIYHERYYFENEVTFVRDMTLQEIFEKGDLSATLDELEEVGTDGTRFRIDWTEHRPDEFELKSREIDTTKINKIHIDTLLIYDATSLMTVDNSSSIVFGKTNSKYGLLDYKDGE